MKALRSYRTVVCCCLLLLSMAGRATVYNVSTKSNLQTRMNAALPGDTVIVANGVYDWGQINFTNNNGTSSSAWIVLKAQTFRGVTFTGSTYLQFKGMRVKVDGFVFANGSAGTNAVISFRNSSGSNASYCRISNIVIDNYNTLSADTSVENEWVGLYGTYNRVDHCTFVNKSNPRATIVVWYGSTTYPAPAASTYHLIDSNYFRQRTYLGDNGGETIRVGTSTSSRTNGYNVIEYNLFEDMIQTEPEIVSNKSNFNTYRYNTFKNCSGGLTLRHGRYCSVYGNSFIVTNTSVTNAYGVRTIDKGHRIFNNYFEAVNGNQSGGSTQLRAPINLYNGVTRDTTDAAYAAQYFPADSCLVAFNTIVNAKGGGGIVLGGTGGGTVQPLGIRVANNVIKMQQGTAVYKNTANTTLTYTAEGNLYNAPSGLGITPTTGFSNTTLTFGARANGVLTPPSVVQDAAVNTASYTTLLNAKDMHIRTRSSVYDAGAVELNGSGSVTAYPLDSTLVGAGKPVAVALSMRSFTATNNNGVIQFAWSLSGSSNIVSFDVQQQEDGRAFKNITTILASDAVEYQYQFKAGRSDGLYRLKINYKEGESQYSSIVMIRMNNNTAINVYPNPAKGSCTVYLKERAASGSILSVITAAGKTVKVVSNLMAGSNPLNLQGLTSGLYYIRIQHPNHSVSISPINVQ